VGACPPKLEGLHWLGNGPTSEGGESDGMMDHELVW
jgi:hypothetical protein